MTNPVYPQYQNVWLTGADKPGEGQQQYQYCVLLLVTQRKPLPKTSTAPVAEKPQAYPSVSSTRSSA